MRQKNPSATAAQTGVPSEPTTIDATKPAGRMKQKQPAELTQATAARTPAHTI
jgi:hypothetical protein